MFIFLQGKNHESILNPYFFLAGKTGRNQEKQESLKLLPGKKSGEKKGKSEGYISFLINTILFEIYNFFTYLI